MGIQIFIGMEGRTILLLRKQSICLVFLAEYNQGFTCILIHLECCIVVIKQNIWETLKRE